MSLLPRTGFRSYFPYNLALMVYTYVKINLSRIIYFVIRINDKPVHPFLNEFLTALVDAGVGFIATAFLFILCIYLLLATIKGNLKFGSRIFCCFSIHPMMYIAFI